MSDPSPNNPLRRAREALRPRTRLKCALKLLRRRWGALAEARALARVEPTEYRHFWIVSAQRNAGEAACRCLDSVYGQRYPQDKVTQLFIDDASEDDTVSIVEDWLAGHEGHCVELVRNAERIGCCANNARAYRQAPPGSIIVEINGDDWLPDPDVFDTINRVYEDPEVWMTYNTALRSDGLVGKTRPIPREVIERNAYREVGWMASHLHTFRAELFTHVREDSLIDPDTGEHWAFAQDVAIYSSLLELAGFHARHMYRYNYVYNFHEQTEHKTNREAQLACVARMRQMPRYEPLAELTRATGD